MKTNKPIDKAIKLSKELAPLLRAIKQGEYHDYAQQLAHLKLQAIAHELAQHFNR